MVAEVVTAVTETETAPAATEAPPIETQSPETAQVQGSETPSQEAPETVPDPLANLDPDVVFNHPIFKDRLARETESVRRKSERETETRIQDARSNWVASGQAFNEVVAALEAGNAQQAQRIIEATLSNRDWAAVGVIDRIGRAKLPEGKVSTEDIDALDRALDAARRGTGTLDQYAETLLEVRAKAYAENVLAPQIEQRIAKENAQKAKAAAKASEVQSAEAASSAQGRPTLGVPGAGGAKVMLTTAELDSIPTNTFLNLSKEVQQRLVTEAREADRLHPGRNDRSLVSQVLGR